jgi:hypothetical protein
MCCGDDVGEGRGERVREWDGFLREGVRVR